jgi:hypothetical protein
MILSLLLLLMICTCLLSLLAVLTQDLLGVMFSVNMLKVLRLPSLKICTCLLSVMAVLT